MIASEITIIAEIIPRFTGRDVPISEIAKAMLTCLKQSPMPNNGEWVLLLSNNSRRISSLQEKQLSLS